MILKSLFREKFLEVIQQYYFELEIINTHPFYVVSVDNKVFVHLVPVQNSFNPSQLIALQQSYALEQKMLVHLWEDVWLAKQSQVLSRIKSFCGKNEKVHGRKAKIVELSMQQTSSFLEDNHLQGYVKAKHNYGLAVDGHLLGVACFSNTRPMKSKGDNYLSAELVRFATLAGYTIVGGLDKLVKHFLSKTPTNDLMTYADRDWSLGGGYNKLKFINSAVVDSSYFHLDTQSLIRYRGHRLPKKITEAFAQQNELSLLAFLKVNNFVTVFNTGNLKYHFYV